MPNTFIVTDPVLGMRQGSANGSDTSADSTGHHGAQFELGYRVLMSHNRTAKYCVASAAIALSTTVSIAASGTASSTDGGAWVALGSVTSGNYFWARELAVFCSTG